MHLDNLVSVVKTMAKETKKKTSATKKDISRLRREQRQRRIILIISITSIALVVLVIAYGLLNTLVLEGLKAVARVNGDTITLNEYQKEVRYQRYQAIRQYEYYHQVYQIYMALDPDGLGATIKNDLQQIAYNLSEFNQLQFGSDVLDQMIDNILIRQYAVSKGISVSQSEIDEALQGAFGFYAQGTPTPTSTVTPFMTSTLSALQLQLVTPTPTATLTIEPTLNPTVEVTPEPTLEAEAEAAAEQITEEVQEVTATITPTSEPTLTSTPYTYDGYITLRDSLLDELKEIGITRTDLENVFQTELLRKKVLEEITSEITADQEQVWARHILVADDVTAMVILEKLKTGEDWTTLAAEYSIDESNKARGGNLGWFSRGAMVQPFEEAAFNLEIGEISEPVQTEFGWHIIQSLGHEVRSITPSALQTMKNQKFSSWLESLKTEESVRKYDNWQGKIPMIPTIPPELILET